MPTNVANDYSSLFHIKIKIDSRLVATNVWSQLHCGIIPDDRVVAPELVDCIVAYRWRKVELFGSVGVEQMRLNITTAQACRQIVEFDQVAEDALVGCR